MIVVDTNVLSELGKNKPDPKIVDWFGERRVKDLFLCAPVLAELVYGARKHKIRSGSNRYFGSLDFIRNEIVSERFLDFDDRCASTFGLMRAEREAAGRGLMEFDLMIAATCRIHGAALATRNVKDFAGLDLRLINPFEGRDERA